MKYNNCVKIAQSYNECFIVAGGPSLKNFNWSLLSDKFIIAINRAYEVLPNAQIVYFTDCDWFETHKDKLKLHAGCKIKGSMRIDKFNSESAIDKQFKLFGKPGLNTDPNCLNHGNNSLYAAINLAAVHLQFKKIYLLGADMKHEGNNTHWHSGHKRVDPPTVFNMMLRNFDTMLPQLTTMGVEIINCNFPESTNLRIFPIQTPNDTFTN